MAKVKLLDLLKQLNQKKQTKNRRKRPGYSGERQARRPGNFGSGAGPQGGPGGRPQPGPVSGPQPGPGFGGPDVGLFGSTPNAEPNTGSNVREQEAGLFGPLGGGEGLFGPEVGPRSGNPGPQVDAINDVNPYDIFGSPPRPDNTNLESNSLDPFGPNIKKPGDNE